MAAHDPGVDPVIQTARRSQHRLSQLEVGHGGISQRCVPRRRSLVADRRRGDHQVAKAHVRLNGSRGSNSDEGRRADGSKLFDGDRG